MVAKKKKTSTNFYGNTIEKGTLHKALGYKPGEKIPPSKVNEIAQEGAGGTVTAKSGKKVKITPKLRAKAQFAKNARKFNH